MAGIKTTHKYPYDKQVWCHGWLVGPHPYLPGYSVFKVKLGTYVEVQTDIVKKK